jgi:hypothetical protein
MGVSGAKRRAEPRERRAEASGGSDEEGGGGDGWSAPITWI